MTKLESDGWDYGERPEIYRSSWDPEYRKRLDAAFVVSEQEARVSTLKAGTFSPLTKQAIKVVDMAYEWAARLRRR